MALLKYKMLQPWKYAFKQICVIFGGRKKDTHIVQERQQVENNNLSSSEAAIDQRRTEEDYPKINTASREVKSEQRKLVQRFHLDQSHPDISIK